MHSASSGNIAYFMQEIFGLIFGSLIVESQGQVFRGGRGQREKGAHQRCSQL